MPQVEIYTPTGVVSGSTPRTELDGEASGAPPSIPVEGSRWYPLDGSQPTRRGRLTVASDDILVVVTTPPEVAVHEQWYPIELEIGPYHLAAHLPTAPGFDPARALARPSGAYVALRDATIRLIDRPEAGSPLRPYVLVNRYAVNRIASSMMLAFFFPGAEQLPAPDESAVPLVAGTAIPAA